MLPFLALSSLGGAAGCLVAGLTGQNYIARYIHPDIPINAKPYPNCIETHRGKETNTTLLGLAALLGVAGTTAVVGRWTVMYPIVKSLRSRYLCLPGTDIPRRITSFKGLLLDISPNVIGYAAPLSVGLLLGVGAKVCIEGPGRFTNYRSGQNPYAERLQRHLALWEMNADSVVGVDTRYSAAQAVKSHEH